MSSETFSSGTDSVSILLLRRSSSSFCSSFTTGGAWLLLAVFAGGVGGEVVFGHRPCDVGGGVIAGGTGVGVLDEAAGSACLNTSGNVRRRWAHANSFRASFLSDWDLFLFVGISLSPQQSKWPAVHLSFSTAVSQAP